MDPEHAQPQETPRIDRYGHGKSMRAVEHE
jgi:hypothetical protein